MGLVGVGIGILTLLVVKEPQRQVIEKVEEEEEESHK